MPTQHTVKQGECLSSIARNYGFDDWRVIYNHPDNAQFKQEHPNPNLIYPGDKLVIPDLDEGGVAGPTETKHKFEIKLDETLLRIVVQDMLDQPFGNRKFKLTFAALPLIEGTTAVDGRVGAPDRRARSRQNQERPAGPPEQSRLRVRQSG
jgi:N-acetylmuramoyl-L-alanine amidase